MISLSNVSSLCLWMWIYQTLQDKFVAIELQGDVQNEGSFKALKFSLSLEMSKVAATYNLLLTSYLVLHMN